MAKQTQVTPKSADVTARGIRFRYYEWPGNGPTVVMLHPSRGFARIWEFLVPHLTPEFRIIALDQRGHGDSDRPDGSYAGEDFADDLEAFLDKLNIQKCILVGHSLGGRVGQIFAGRHPERVSKLVLVGGPHPESFGATPEMVKANNDKVAKERKALNVFDDEPAALKAVRELWPELKEDKVRHVFQYNMKRNTDGTFSFKFDRPKVAEGLDHIVDNLTKYVGSITCPTLFLFRSHGINHLDMSGAKRIATCYKKAPVSIEMVDGIAMVQLENPDGVGLAVRKFLLA